MRPRIYLNALAHAEGDSDVYHAHHRAHIKRTAKAHEEFTSSEMGKSFIAIASERPSTYQPIYTEYCLFGTWYPLKRGADVQRYKDAGYQLR